MRRIAVTLSLLLFFSSITVSPGWSAALDDVNSDANFDVGETMLRRVLETSFATQDAAGFAITVEMLVAAAPERTEAIRAYAASLTGPDPEPEDMPEAPPTVKETIFDLGAWDGGIELGFSTSSGNTQEKAIAVGFEIKRLISEHWDHKLEADFDFARRAGITSKERYSGRYQLYYRGWERSYVYMFLDGERDRFSGFDYRLTQSIGAGYKIIDSERQSWTVEGGPGLRETRVMGNGFSTEPLGVLNTEYQFLLTPGVSIDLGASVFVGDARTTLESEAALKAQLNSSLSARFSYKTKYDSSVPLGSRKTDTLTRATLVYGF